MELSCYSSIPDQLSDAVETVYSLDVPKSVIDQLAKDPEAVEALNDLDIDPRDHDYLSDILDPDNGGFRSKCLT